MSRKPNRTLLGSITQRATKTFPLELPGESPETSENWDLWVQHWFKTAETMHSEFVSEGLVRTAEAVYVHIEWQRNMFAKELADV